MSVSIKTANEIELMREAGRLLEKVHDELRDLSVRVFPPSTLTSMEKSLSVRWAVYRIS